MSAALPQAGAAPVAANGAAVAAPQVAPAPTPQYTPPPPSTPTPIASDAMDNGGGEKSNPFREFFSDINVLDVAISAFIVGAVIYSIQYHKLMMMLEKTGYADLSTRVQKLESALESAKRKAELNATGRNGRTSRKRGLITL